MSLGPRIRAMAGRRRVRAEYRHNIKMIGEQNADHPISQAGYRRGARGGRGPLRRRTRLGTDPSRDRI